MFQIASRTVLISKTSLQMKDPFPQGLLCEAFPLSISVDIHEDLSL